MLDYARITFMIGNGFDLELGLKTKYKDFISVYTKLSTDDKVLKDFRENVDQDSEAWSDAEVQMGRLTHKYDASKEEELRRSYRDFVKELGNYFAKEQKRVIDAEKENELAERVFRGLLSFCDKLEEPAQKAVKKTLEQYGILDYSILDYNYTTLIDTAFHNIKNNKKLIGTHSGADGSLYSVEFSSICHVHGRLDKAMILGVDNRKQIAKAEFMNNPKFVRAWIKPEVNKNLRYGYDEEAKRIIDDSCVICIYGMSIGETDTTWWTYVMQWLAADENHQLIVFIYDKDYDPRIPDDLFENQDKLKVKLMKNGGVDEQTWNKLAERVSIAINANLFGGRLIPEEKEGADIPQKRKIVK